MLIELLVAGSLGLVALSVLGNNVIPALATLANAAQADEGALELELAADILVRAIGPATGWPDRIAVTREGEALLLDPDGGSAPQAAWVAIVDGRILLGEPGTTPGSFGPDVAVLADDLDATSRLALLDRMGDPLSNDASPPVAVLIELVREGRSVRRLVALRRWS